MTPRPRAHRAAAVLVASALALAASPTLPAAAVPVRAAAPGYVGIVIGGQGSSCVRWHSGITGDEILNDVTSVNYRPRDGLITQIGGRPSSNSADSTHYWSYWHDSSGSWQYSNSGASGYQPRAGSVEGWSYVNGSSSASPPGAGAGGLYSSLCGARDAPASPTHRRTSSPPAVHRSSSVVTRPARSSPAGTGTSVARGASTAAGTSRPTSSTSPSGAAGSSSGSSSTAGVVLPAGPSSAAPSFADASSVAQKSSSGGSALPVILGVALVLLLGAGGGWGVLRRRRADAAEH